MKDIQKIYHLLNHFQKFHIPMNSKRHPFQIIGTIFQVIKVSTAFFVIFQMLNKYFANIHLVDRKNEHKRKRECHCSCF